MPEEESLTDIIKKLKLAVPILALGILVAVYIGYTQVYPVITSIQELKEQVVQQTTVLADKQRELDDLNLQIKKQLAESTIEKAIVVPEAQGLPAEDMIAGEFA
ncbi:hypothetical protein J6A64_05525 [bacterium]|nr:hypothetical protein [bacterium]